jgi:hypothetical protein
MNRVPGLFLAAPLLLGIACGLGDSSGQEYDAGRKASDASVTADASRPRDSGSDRRDAAEDAGEDAGQDRADASAIRDASQAKDSGSEAKDAGQDASHGQDAGGGGADGSSPPAGAGPCDIYAAGNTPCVAAYSTTRALSGAYAGNLYQVRRSDGATKDIPVLSPGGIADSAAQDTFCPGKGSCTISIIYDQSGKGNHLTKAPGGSKVYGPNDDVEAVADALPIKLSGQKVYGVHVVGSPSWTAPGQVGYRNTKTNGIAKGDNPETEYMVTDGTYFNGSCCFDFGNAEMLPVAGGYGTMETIYFGNCDWWDTGAGNGPWIMADLEVGVYNHGGKQPRDNSNRQNPKDISFSYDFVTAMLKGNSAKATSGGPFTLKGGNAQSGTLTKIWDGAYPDGYSPMNRQGGVVLGVGGDNSSMAHGNFFEGVMTTGYSSTATDDAVQANIVAAGYGR